MNIFRHRKQIRKFRELVKALESPVYLFSATVYNFWTNHDCTIWKPGQTLIDIVNHRWYTYTVIIEVN